MGYEPTDGNDTGFVRRYNKVAESENYSDDDGRNTGGVEDVLDVLLRYGRKSMPETEAAILLVAI